MAERGPATRSCGSRGDESEELQRRLHPGAWVDVQPGLELFPLGVADLRVPPRQALHHADLLEGQRRQGGVTKEIPIARICSARRWSNRDSIDSEAVSQSVVGRPFSTIHHIRFATAHRP